MRGRLVRTFAVLGPFVVLACNALTGAGDLAVCEGAECAGVGSSTSSGGTSSGGTSSSGGGEGDGSVDAPPQPCTGDTKTCMGNTLSACVNNTIQTTACAQACLDGACVPYPSCRGTTNSDACQTGGPAGNCCDDPPVSGGMYNRNGNAQLAAMISAFKLDKYEVTVARFRAFVTDGGGTQAKAPAADAGAHPKIANSGWKTAWNKFLPATTAGLKSNLGGGTWMDTAGTVDEDLRPITNVTWFEAFAFCAWDGGRLPTSAEWGYAAVNGSEGRVYPWSSPATSTTIDTTYAAYYCAVTAPKYNCPASYTQCNGGTQGGMTGCTVGSTTDACFVGGGSCANVVPPCTGCTNPTDVARVGSYAMKGTSMFGQLDLAGNASEWTLDTAGTSKDPVPPPTPCTDCAQLVPADPTAGTPMGSDDTLIIFRGGSWDDTSSETAPAALRGRSFDTVVYNKRDPAIGFRCAHD